MDPELWNQWHFYDYIIARSDEKLARLSILGSKSKPERYRHLIRQIRQRAWTSKFQMLLGRSQQGQVQDWNLFEPLENKLACSSLIPSLSQSLQDSRMPVEASEGVTLELPQEEILAHFTDVEDSHLYNYVPKVKSPLKSHTMDFLEDATLTMDSMDFLDCDDAKRAMSFLDCDDAKRRRPDSPPLEEQLIECLEETLHDTLLLKRFKSAYPSPPTLD